VWAVEEHCLQRSIPRRGLMAALPRLASLVDGASQVFTVTLSSKGQSPMLFEPRPRRVAKTHSSTFDHDALLPR
jgi:hypothetical protein